MISKTELYGYSVIAVLLPALIFLVFILWQMHRNGFSYGRKIPMPPHCKHGFEISEVANFEIDPCCKYCGGKLSELRR
jgi:hypothetical protein